MNQRTILISASFSGASAVALGAFGAHALREILTINNRQDIYELAVRYQFYHSLALLAAGILVEKFPKLNLASNLFIIGITIFSGSLYILSITNQSWWGMITPVGGLALLGGWLYFARAVFKQNG